MEVAYREDEDQGVRLLNRSFIVTEEDFPHGLRCAGCDKALEPGSMAAERFFGAMGFSGPKPFPESESDDPVLEIVCQRCAG